MLLLIQRKFCFITWPVNGGRQSIMAQALRTLVNSVLFILDTAPNK